MVTDFLGTELQPGMKVIFQGSYQLEKATVIALDETRSNSIQILCEGNTKPGWTFPKRIVINNKEDAKA